jgi:hypothetical protein
VSVRTHQRAMHDDLHLPAPLCTQLSVFRHYQVAVLGRVGGPQWTSEECMTICICLCVQLSC